MSQGNLTVALVCVQGTKYEICEPTLQIQEQRIFQSVLGVPRVSERIVDQTKKRLTESVVYALRSFKPRKLKRLAVVTCCHEICNVTEVKFGFMLIKIQRNIEFRIRLSSLVKAEPNDSEDSVGSPIEWIFLN